MRVIFAPLATGGCLLLGWTCTLFISAAATFAGEPDLQQSTIQAKSESVAAGDIITVTVTLKNTGTAPSEGTDLRITLPHSGFLVRIDELPGMKHDTETREITARLDLGAGEQRSFAFDLLAPRTAAGRQMVTGIEFRNFLKEEEWFAESSIEITSAKSSGGLVLGGLRFHPAAGWRLAWIAAGGVLYMWVRSVLGRLKLHSSVTVMGADLRRCPPFAIVSLLMIPMAFFMVFAGMAWRDYQTVTVWKETTATVLDRREVISTSTSHRPERIDGVMKKRTSTTRSPEFALKYEVGDETVISSGYETGSSVHIGGNVTALEQMADWRPGKTIPCWYDPVNPRDVIVRRGFGGAYFFALIPLPIFGFGLHLVRLLLKGLRESKTDEHSLIPRFADRTDF